MKLIIEITHYPKRDTWYAQADSAGEFKGYGVTKYEALRELVNAIEIDETESETLLEQLQASIDIYRSKRK